MNGRRLGICAAAFLIGILTLAVAAHAEMLYQDDFTTARGRYEFVGGNIWKIAAGQCRFAASVRDCFAVVNLEDVATAEIRGSLCVSRRTGTGYVTAGLTLFDDNENHWRLLLVAAPVGKNYFDSSSTTKEYTRPSGPGQPAGRRLPPGTRAISPRGNTA